MPLIAVSTPSKIPLIPFQIPVKISFTPVQTMSQFPVKIPANTSKSPVRTSSTVPSTAEMIWNAPSNTGARRSQKPSHMALRVSMTSPQSIPRALSRSVIPCAKAANFSLISSQIAVIFSRNSSFVCQRCTKAATSAAIIAITIPIGDVSAPIAFPRTPVMPPAACIFPARFMIPTPSFEKPCIATPTVLIVLPMISSSGPMAAASASTLMIVSR